MPTLHPATRLLIWVLALIVAQRLAGPSLLAALAASTLFGRASLRRGARLVWRTRWLLLSLSVIYAWATAGEPLWASDYAPTQEGLQEATTHVGRLLLVLMAVAIFIERMPLSDMLAATHRVLSPLTVFGLDPDRGVVRMMLALRYAESLPRPRDWRTLLEMPDAPLDERVEVHRIPFAWPDAAVVLFLVVTLGFFGLR